LLKKSGAGLYGKAGSGLTGKGLSGSGLYGSGLYGSGLYGYGSGLSGRGLSGSGMRNRRPMRDFDEEDMGRMRILPYEPRPAVMPRKSRNNKEGSGFFSNIGKDIKKAGKREKPLYLENELEMKQRLYYLLLERFWVRQLVLWQVGHLVVRLEVLLEVLVESI